MIEGSALQEYMIGMILNEIFFHRRGKYTKILYGYSVLKRSKERMFNYRCSLIIALYNSPIAEESIKTISAI